MSVCVSLPQPSGCQQNGTTMCTDTCGTRWGRWFQAISYHISIYFRHIFGIYAIHIFLIKMPHKTDMPNKFYYNNDGNNNNNNRSAVSCTFHNKPRQSRRKFTKSQPPWLKFINHNSTHMKGNKHDPNCYQFASSALTWFIGKSAKNLMKIYQCPF